MLTDDGGPVRRSALGLAAAAPATLIPKAALLFALNACSSQPRARRESGEFRVLASRFSEEGARVVTDAGSPCEH